MTAVAIKIEKKEKVENPPLLCDLTTPQRKASTRHGLAAEQTLTFVQKLYEAEFVTYPGTSGRYIPEGVLDEVSMLLDRLTTHSSSMEKIGALDGLNRRSVDAPEVTDHYALLVTLDRPLVFYKGEQTIYDMIVGRMVEAFSLERVKDTTIARAECKDIAFETKGYIVRKAG